MTARASDEYPQHSRGRQALAGCAFALLAVFTLSLSTGCSNVSSLQQKYEAGDERERERALKKLIEIVSRPDYPYGTRRNAARALGEIGDPVAVPALIGALHSFEKRTTFKEEAVIALGKIGDRSAVEPMGRLMDRSLGDEYVDLRLTTWPVISQLGGPKAAEILVAALQYYDFLTLRQEQRGMRGVFTGEENPWFTREDSLRFPKQMFDDPALGSGLGGLGGGRGSPIGMFGPDTSPAPMRRNFTPEERQLAHQSLVSVGEDALPVIETQIRTKQTTPSLRQELLAIMEEITLENQRQPEN